MADGREKLQSYIRARKKDLGLTWAQVGPTLRRWEEKGIPPRPTDKALRAMDDFMGWRPQSAEAVLNGGAPEFVAEAPNRNLGALVRSMRETLDEMAQIVEEQP